MTYKTREVTNHRLSPPVLNTAKHTVGECENEKKHQSKTRNNTGIRPFDAGSSIAPGHFSRHNHSYETLTVLPTHFLKVLSYFRQTERLPPQPDEPGLNGATALSAESEVAVENRSATM